MKKILFFLVVILCGCSPVCTIAQISDQYVYVDQYCKAQLPDYKLQAKVTAGCFGYSLTQTPAPGTILSATNKVVTVTLKATGTNGKSTSETFRVTLLDTITPRITVPIASVDELLKKSQLLYDTADRMVGMIDSVFTRNILVVASWDSAGVRQRFVSYTDTFDLAILK
ncbi:MAG: Hyalin repeat protein [candidate division TM6 bacterium GW2011_GWF2_33_332]|nr:MAG: Hyalin repeat protein [candidate division TM6 bacterium GW2011_GWF2_33_332]